MPVAFHIVNTPKLDAAEAYRQAWQRLDEIGARHPLGRISHTAWLDGDVLHVVDVWESEEDFNRFVGSTLAGLLEEFGMALAGPPEKGKFLQTILAGRAPTNTHG